MLGLLEAHIDGAAADLGAWFPAAIVHTATSALVALGGTRPGLIASPSSRRGRNRVAT